MDQIILYPVFCGLVKLLDFVVFLLARATDLDHWKSLSVTCWAPTDRFPLSVGKSAPSPWFSNFPGPMAWPLNSSGTLSIPRLNHGDSTTSASRSPTPASRYRPQLNSWLKLQTSPPFQSGVHRELPMNPKRWHHPQVCRKGCRNQMETSFSKLWRTTFLCRENGLFSVSWIFSSLCVCLCVTGMAWCPGRREVVPFWGLP